MCAMWKVIWVLHLWCLLFFLTNMKTDSKTICLFILRYERWLHTQSTNHFALSQCLPDFINTFVQPVSVTLASEFSNPWLCLYILNFWRMKKYQVNFFSYNINNNNNKKKFFLRMEIQMSSLPLCCFPEIMGPKVSKFQMQTDKHRGIRISDKVIQLWKIKPCGHLSWLHSLTRVFTGRRLLKLCLQGSNQNGYIYQHSRCPWTSAHPQPTTIFKKPLSY